MGKRSQRHCLVIKTGHDFNHIYRNLQFNVSRSKRETYTLDNCKLFRTHCQREIVVVDNISVQTGHCDKHSVFPKKEQVENKLMWVQLISTKGMGANRSQVHVFFLFLPLLETGTTLTWPRQASLFPSSLDIASYKDFSFS